MTQPQLNNQILTSLTPSIKKLTETIISVKIVVSTPSDTSDTLPHLASLFSRILVDPSVISTPEVLLYLSNCTA